MINSLLVWSAAIMVATTDRGLHSGFCLPSREAECVYTRTGTSPRLRLLASDPPALAGTPRAVPLVNVASIGVALISDVGALAAVDIWL